MFSPSLVQKLQGSVWTHLRSSRVPELVLESHRQPFVVPTQMSTVCISVLYRYYIDYSFVYHAIPPNFSFIANIDLFSVHWCWNGHYSSYTDLFNTYCRNRNMEGKAIRYFNIFLDSDIFLYYLVNRYSNCCNNEDISKIISG